MSAPSTVIRGIVRNGVVVLEPPAALPEGTEVQIVVTPMPFTPDEQAEFDAWDKLSDEAWGMIDRWENEDDHAAG
ncbi:MAG: hypothetical protein JWO38_1687 [Gemmataceae bacterium]|nr:hypothetical protein [Gemmataceae bacterium]